MAAISELIAADELLSELGRIGGLSIMCLRAASRTLYARLSPEEVPWLWSDSWPQHPNPDTPALVRDLTPRDTPVLARGLTPLGADLLRDTYGIGIYSPELWTAAAYQACLAGRLDMLVWFVWQIPCYRGGVSRRCSWSDCIYCNVEGGSGLLQAACAGGSLEVVRWVAAEFATTRETMRAGNCKPLVCAAAAGHLPVAQWLVETFSLNLADLWVPQLQMLMGGYPVFTLACVTGQLHVVKWLAARFKLTPAEFRFPVAGTMCPTCFAGKAAVVRWLVRTYYVEDRARGYLPGLHEAIVSGKLPIVRWMVRWYGVTHKQIAQRDYWPLRLACVRGHLDVARWLAGAFRLRTMVPKATARAILEGSIDHGGVVKWLWRAFRITFCAQN